MFLFYLSCDLWVILYTEPWCVWYSFITVVYTNIPQFYYLIHNHFTRKFQLCIITRNHLTVIISVFSGWWHCCWLYSGALDCQLAAMTHGCLCQQHHFMLWCPRWDKWGWHWIESSAKSQSLEGWMRVSVFGGQMCENQVFSCIVTNFVSSSLVFGLRIHNNLDNTEQQTHLYSILFLSEMEIQENVGQL